MLCWDFAGVSYSLYVVVSYCPNYRGVVGGVSLFIYVVFFGV